jgi:hypothetical protein
LCALAMSAGSAHADDPFEAPPPAAGVMVAGPGVAQSLTGPTVWAILPWGGYGVGGRMMIPLGIPGVIRSPFVVDNFAIDVGADVLHWSYDYGYAPGGYGWTEVLVVGGFMWDFWFTNRFAIYPKAELGYALGWFSGFDGAGTRPTYGGFFIAGDAGVVYKLDAGLTLRAEIGSSGAKVGVAWLF